MQLLHCRARRGSTLVCRTSLRIDIQYKKMGGKVSLVNTENDRWWETYNELKQALHIYRVNQRLAVFELQVPDDPSMFASNQRECGNIQHLRPSLSVPLRFPETKHPRGTGRTR